MSEQTSDWLAAGKGLPPQLRWSFTTDAELRSLRLARESGEVIALDDSGGLYQLDRRGRVKQLTRGLRELRGLAWCDTGEAGAALVGESRLCRLNERLEIEWSLELDEPALAVEISPFGDHVAVSLADGANSIYDADQERVGEFMTARPLSLLQFVATEPRLVAAAEYGLICSHDVDGNEVWSTRTWSNIGNLAASGDGHTLFLAAFSHGLQTYGKGGENRASYVLEGTANRVAASYTGERIVAATLERHLYWLDSDGQLLWAAPAPDDLQSVACDPLGEWIVCGFRSGRIMRLDWDSSER